jgi:riboflavin synthase
MLPRSVVADRTGDSVAISGCCLTASAVESDTISFHVVPETVARSTLGALEAMDNVNVEPALRAGDPLGGHYVQGHVDTVGHVQSVEAEGEGLRVFVEAPDEVLRYCVEKGSVTIDGVSLTVAELAEDAFAVALVPHTLEATTLSDLSPGQAVNVEVDVLAKYVERLLLR